MWTSTLLRVVERIRITVASEGKWKWGIIGKRLARPKGLQSEALRAKSPGVVLGKRALGRGTKPSPHQLGGLASAVSSQAGWTAELRPPDGFPVKCCRWLFLLQYGMTYARISTRKWGIIHRFTNGDGSIPYPPVSYTYEWSTVKMFRAQSISLSQIFTARRNARIASAIQLWQFRPSVRL